MLPRVRFAPSPTGYLHIGGARTALFNWLFARHHGGAFVLRIEDTDVERSSGDMVAGILEGLRWLGLDWDEGPGVGGPHAPYFQSERLDRYRSVAEQLVDSGHAYFCYCTAERLQQQRLRAEAAGSAWIYDRRCLSLSVEERTALEAARAPHAIRFRVPPGRTTFTDLVHGSIAFENATIEDFVILRSDAHPTYHLSVVADDVDMAITHVVRGDDHVSNTPKHVLLYEAIGSPIPAFAHVPLILGPDRKRLSKRHGATSVIEYKRLGYLPEAMLNFFALLGWSPGDNQEIFTTDELIREFGLTGISGANAVFNPEKLDWINAQHIARLPVDVLVARIRPELEKAGLWRDELVGAESDWIRRAVMLVLPRVRRLGDFVAQLRPFLAADVEYDVAAIDKYLNVPGLAALVSNLGAAFAAIPVFDAASTESALRATAAASSVKAGVLIHATRVAVTGQSVSPGLFDVLDIAGRTRVIERLRELERFLRARAA
jgi:glutamyl-tRNA synthetase